MSYIIKTTDDEGRDLFVEEIFPVTKGRDQHVTGYKARIGFNPAKAEKLRDHANADKVASLMVDLKGYRDNRWRVVLDPNVAV
jgi:hypothetical protein